MLHYFFSMRLRIIRFEPNRYLSGTYGTYGTYIKAARSIVSLIFRCQDMSTYKIFFLLEKFPAWIFLRFWVLIGVPDSGLSALFFFIMLKCDFR